MKVGSLKLKFGRSLFMAELLKLVNFPTGFLNRLVRAKMIPNAK
jgi:hypothetical protein